MNNCFEVQGNPNAYKRRINPNKLLVNVGNTLSMQQFADEVFNNIHKDIKSVLLGRPRFYPELKSEVWFGNDSINGEDVYCFKIKREVDLGKNCSTSTIDRQRRDGYIYDITDEDYKKDKKNLDSYINLHTNLSSGIVYQKGFDYGLNEKPLRGYTNIYKIVYESSAITICFKPIPLTKQNAQKLGQSIRP